MGAVPVQANAFGDFVAGLIKAIMTGGATAAEAYITALDPEILALPLVQILLDDGIDALVGSITTGITNIATGVIVDIQVNGENSSAVTAAVALQYALAGKDPNAISTARANACQAYLLLGHWDGVVTS